MKNLMRALFVVVVLGVASCTNVCQTVSDWGAEYSGVKLSDESTYYRHNGKNYVKGQRCLCKRTFVDHPYAIRKKLPEQYRAIEGSEGDTVYREIRIRRDGSAVYADDSTWRQLELKNPQPFTLKKNLTERNEYVFEHTRRPTWHALYAYPLSAASFVCVDLPLNVAGAAAAVAFSLPFIPGVMICSQQQQEVPPPSTESIPQN